MLDYFPSKEIPTVCKRSNMMQARLTAYTSRESVFAPEAILSLNQSHFHNHIPCCSLGHSDHHLTATVPLYNTRGWKLSETLLSQKRIYFTLIELIDSFVTPCRPGICPSTRNISALSRRIYFDLIDEATYLHVLHGTLLEDL